MVSTTTLKNAAFAIEHDLFTDPDECNYLVKDGAILRRWEPLADDGDAFRLMARLGITVDAYDRYDQVIAEGAGQFEAIVIYSDNRLDDYRLAILVCAARIGASINRSPENH